MSQSQTELGLLRKELDLAKRSAADSLSRLEADLELAKENCNQVYAELQAARESSSQAEKEVEMLRDRLETSLKLEAELKTQVKKEEEELESKFPLLILSLSFLIWFPSDLCLRIEHRVGSRKQFEDFQEEIQ